MLASVDGEVLSLFFAVLGLVIYLALWFIHINIEIRERLARLETKANLWENRDDHTG